MSVTNKTVTNGADEQAGISYTQNESYVTSW